MMKKFLYSIVVLFLMLIIPNSVNATECSDSEIIRLQKIANNVNTNYTYDEGTKKFNVTFTNLTKELVLKSINDNKDYNTDREITLKNLYSGNHKFYVYAKNRSCIKEVLSTKYITLPYYNNYYNYEECRNIPNYSYCQRWLKKSIDYLTWHNNVSKYNEKIKKNQDNNSNENAQGVFDKLTDLAKKTYVKYYYIILPLIIMIACTVIYTKNKKDDLV